MGMIVWMVGMMVLGAAGWWLDELLNWPLPIGLLLVVAVPCWWLI